MAKIPMCSDFGCCDDRVDACKHCKREGRDFYFSCLKATNQRKGKN